MRIISKLIYISIIFDYNIKNIKVKFKYKFYLINLKFYKLFQIFIIYTYFY